MTSRFKLVLMLGMRGAILLCPILLTPYLLHAAQPFLEANRLASEEIPRILWRFLTAFTSAYHLSLS